MSSAPSFCLHPLFHTPWHPFASIPAFPASRWLCALVLSFVCITSSLPWPSLGTDVGCLLFFPDDTHVQLHTPFSHLICICQPPSFLLPLHPLAPTRLRCATCTSHHHDFLQSSRTRLAARFPCLSHPIIFPFSYLSASLPLAPPRILLYFNLCVNVCRIRVIEKAFNQSFFYNIAMV